MIRIRLATENDIPRLNDLLSQVLTVHQKGRPDLFKPGTRKYTEEELRTLLADPMRPVYVFDDEAEGVLGYAFCIVQEQPETHTLYARKTLYIDDLCVDERARRQKIGQTLFEHVKAVAEANGFDAVTLNVWHLNSDAEAFYRALGMQPLKTTMEMKLK